ncbi:MerC domain-containing protein [Xanthomonas campestris pv. campestris]|uniref:MerC domain-containing protein n=1 Tax=Xanthomonas campestris TaxID=339 RepID=UPI00226AEB41|nr:MerC domain-containing protein [Xanthomonas campestris]MEB1347532.1 MerC domain-containing protein [Xanthomonas campestris pv. campestris]WDK49367.1 MerC domain-containing protein [Xanthomonas campestris pv. campestris]WDK54378.1 MerC domain-containing protein [Xanthomonas campestris pv. campestris]WDL63213.1 MerC domain-containing protein [Xanthomonas campestris pv. campestris]WDL67281.1 MerC domain-containing protein [Xanthomonas campestris pv. campestris]
MRATASALDTSAIALSSLCLLHCLALPLLAAALPLLGRWEQAEWVHVVFATAAVPLSGYALWSSHRRHRLPAPVWGLAVFGLAGLVLGASGLLTAALETPVTVAGSLLLACAHLVNLRLRRHVHCVR